MKRTLIRTLAWIMLLFLISCGSVNDKSTLKFIINEDGACDGFGNVTWDMSEAEVIDATGGVKIEFMRGINVENCIFEGLTGLVSYTIDEDKIAGVSFIVEDGEPYESYEAIFNKLTELFGEPTTLTSPEDAKTAGDYNAFSWWNNMIQTSEGDEISITLNLTPVTKNVQMTVAYFPK